MRSYFLPCLVLKLVGAVRRQKTDLSYDLLWLMIYCKDTKDIPKIVKYHFWKKINIYQKIFYIPSFWLWIAMPMNFYHFCFWKSVYEIVCIWIVSSMNCYVYELLCLWISVYMNYGVYKLLWILIVVSMNCCVYELLCLWIKLSMSLCSHELLCPLIIVSISIILCLWIV